MELSGYVFYPCNNFIFYLEGKGIFRTLRFSLSHLPTLMLAIGYPVFWLELYGLRHPQGRTSPLAWILFGLIAGLMIWESRKDIVAELQEFFGWLTAQPPWIRFVLFLSAVGIVLLTLCAFYAALLPPHLAQEYDALNYHLTLPRQHLLLGSFAHIRWATADLYFLPLDFALTPFWLATTLPNKFPQFLFFGGMLGLCVRLVWRFSGGNFWATTLILLAIFGSHNVGIQLGTAMLDVAICYLFLAALDSFLSEKYFLASVELGFYVWSKSFMPIQLAASVILLIGVFFLFRFLKVSQIRWGLVEKDPFGNIQFVAKGMKKACLSFMLVSAIVAGPFLLKNLYYAGTPIFPFGVGMWKINPQVDVHSLAWRSLQENAQEVLDTQDLYGSGRSLVEFIKHFWWIAVPEKGVNNRYDYPVGLMYLLFIGPFLVRLGQLLQKKFFPILPMFVVALWIVWWMGSQQTRFLFVPIILMYIATVSSLKKVSIFLLVIMTCTVLSEGVSVFRAHQPDLGKWGYAVLREQDKKLIALGQQAENKKGAVLDFFDVAFADFPVTVKGVDSVFVLKY